MSLGDDFTPQCNAEKLAMLYLENQNISGKTPTQLHEMYLNAYYEIKNDYLQKLRNGYFATRNNLPPER